MSVDRPVIYPQGAGQINQVQFWWKEPANTGGYPISYYTIQCPEIPFNGSYPARANTAVIPVPNGINYYFTITATNTNGITSAPANFAVISAGSTPDCISTIFVDVISTLYAEVTWTTTVVPEQQAIHSYLVYAVPSTTYLSTLRFPVYAYQSSFNFIGYPSSYSFYVIAVGTGSLGTEKIISTPVASMAGGARPIRSSTATVNSPTGITISWTGSQNATSYQFQVTPDDGSPPFYVTPTTLDGQTATFTDCDTWANYGSGPGYGIVIIATNSNGSSFSPVNNIRFGPLPAYSVRYTGVTSSSFTLRWLGADGASSFRFSLDRGATIISNAWSFGSSIFTGLDYGSSFSGAVVYALNETSTIATPSRAPYSSFILAPGTVTNLTPSLITQSSFSLTWGSVQGASNISYLGTAPATTNGVVGPSLYMGLSAGSYYSTILIPSNSSGTGTAASTLIKTTPGAVTNIGQTMGSGNTLNITWSGSVGAEKYGYLVGGVVSGPVYESTIQAAVVSGLTPNTAYSTAIIAYDVVFPTSGLVGSTLSNYVNLTTGPASATNLTASIIGSDRFSVGWSGAVGATSLIFHYNSSTITVFASGTTNPYVITGLMQNTNYVVYMDSVNVYGVTSSVSISQFTILGVPLLSTTTATSNGFTVYWSGVDTASSMTFYYNDISATVSQESGPSYLVSGLLPNSTYTIYGVAQAANSQRSSLSVNQLTAPTVPTNIGFSGITANQIIVSWTAGVTSSLTLRYGASSVLVYNSPYTISDLAPNTSYDIYFEATNAVANYSTVAYNQTTGPGPATGLIINNVQALQFNVGWSGAAGASSLTFFYNSSSITVAAVASPYTLTGLAANTDYVVYMNTTNSIANSSSLTVSQLTAPLAPTSLSIGSVTDTTMAISWTGGIASSFTFFYGPGSITVGSSVTSPYTISSLAANTSYVVYMAATNLTATVSTLSLTQATAPSATSGLNATVISYSTVSIAWSASPGASSLTFYYNTSSLTVSGLQTPPYLISTLNAGSTYTIYIDSVASSGLRTSSNSVSVLTLPAPAQVQSASNNTPSSFAVSWSGAQGASSLTFLYNTSSLTVSASQSTPYSISSLSAGSTYTIGINATNATGTVSSNQLTAYTAANAAFGLSASNYSLSSFAVSWSGAQGASSLTFFYNTGSLTVPGSQTSPYTISSLNQSTTYAVYINATTSGGLVTSSMYMNVSTYVAPAPATGLTASNNTVSSFAVAWAGAANASSLTFHYNTSTLTVAVSQTSPYTISSLTAGSSYTVYIDTVNIGALVSSQSIIAYTAANAAFGLSASNYSLSSFAVSWSGAEGASSLTFYYNSASLTVPGSQSSPYTISSLNQSTTYAVYIDATTSGGLVTSSMYMNVSTYVAPAPATGLTASNNTGSSFAVAWSGAANASSLTFHYNTSTLTVAVSQTSPYTISSLTAGSSYTVYIDTVNIGALVSSQSIIAYTAALAASNLIASNYTLTSFAVSWSGAQGASSLTFVYNTSSLTVPASQSSPYTISSLAQSTTYTVYINATTNGGLVTSSLNIAATTYVSASEPVGLVASNNTFNSFAISWSGATNASSLTFYYNTSSLTVPASQTSPYTISSLNAGSTYTVYIEATNIGSNVSSQSISAYTAPAKPDNLNVNVISYSTLSVVWTGAQGASSLTFNYNTSSLTVAGSQTSPYLLSSLNAGSSYTIYIDAVADSGLRTSSNSISVLTDPKPAQVLLATLNTPSSFAINWSGAEGASSLTFFYNTSSLTVGGSQTSPYIISSLVAGSAYLVSIDATEGFGPAISSNQITAYTKPVGPSGLASSGITASSVTLSWSGVVGASSLVFYYNSNSLAIAAQASPYTLGNLTPGSTYSIYLDAVANSGLNTPSNTISVLMAPLAPISVATSNYNNTSFDITWAGAQGASSLTFHYNSSTVTVGTQASPYTLTTVTAGSTYTVYVDATNATANVSSGTTIGYTTALAATGLSYTNPSPSTLQIVWSGAAGASSLSFYYNSSVITVPASQTSPYTISTSVGAGSTYTVRISSITSGGLVTTSNSLTAYTSAYAATSLSYSNPGVSSFQVLWSGAGGASSLTFFYNSSVLTVPASQTSPLTISTSVTAGSSYTIVISTITSGGLVTTANGLTAYTKAYPADSLSYINPTSSTLRIAWTGAQGASSLVFFYNSLALIVPASQTSPYTISTSVGAGSSYTVAISSITSGGLVTTSNSLTAYTSANAPTSLLVSNQTYSSFTIAWSGAAGASSLTFYYNTSNLTVPASQTSPYTISSLTVNTTYTIYINAATSGGLFTSSVNVFASTIVAPPTAATGLSATNVSASSFSINWSGATGASSLAFFYNTSSLTVAGTQTSPYTISSLSAGSTYTVYMNAVNISGAASSQSIAVLTAPLVATSVLTGSYSQSSFQITWSGAQGASSLTFRYNSNSVTVANQASPYNLTGLSAGSTYSVSIDATNATATAASGSVNGFTTAYAATGLTASNQGATSFAIAWSGAAGASSLTFNYNTSALTVAASQTSPYTISSLTTNATYTVYITATTSAGYTTNSVSINASTFSNPPTAITNVTTSALTATSVTVGWSGGVGATSYTYTLNGVSATPTSDNGVASKTATFGNLAAGTSYSLVITATNAGGSASSGSSLAGLGGLKAWLDGSDPLNTGVVPSNGTSITSWKDKSGNAYNGAWNNSGSVTLVTNSLNSLSGVSMASGGFSKCPIPVGTFINALTVFLVYKGSGTGNSLVTRTNSATNANLGNPLDMQASGVNTNLLVGPNNAVNMFAPYNLNNTNASIFNLNIDQTTSAITLYSNATSITLPAFSAWTASDNGDLFTVGGRADNGSNITATFYEVVTFNTNLTTTTRQVVEGYLAWKWGLQTSLPASHPYKSVAPTGFPLTFTTPQVAFTPTAASGVPGMQLWFDASDPLATGTGVSNGTAISKWYDKSGNSYNTTAVTGTIPYNSTTGGLTFNGTSYFSLPTSAIPFGNSPFSYYTVGTVTSGSGNFLGGGTLAVRDRVNLYCYGANNYLFLQMGPQISAGPITNGQAFLADWLYDTASNNAYINLNGGTLASTSIGGTMVIPSGPNFIGCNQSSTEPLNGNIKEILVYNVFHTALQRQTVEGYLAWKWGLQSSLPAGHPYKSAAPTNAYTPALSYVQPLYWFDASNSSAYTISGTYVQTWANQGIAGNGIGNYVTHSGTPINSMSTITFGSGGTKYLALPTYEANSYLASMFVVFQGTSMASTNGGYFFFYGSLAGNGSPPDILMYRNNSSDIYIGVSILGGNEHQYQLVGPPINANDTTYTVPSLVSVVTNNTNQTLPQGAWVNGTQATNIKRSGGNTTTKYIDPFLGNNRTDGFSYNMAEYVHFPVVLTTAQRQQVEGYLAWKWGTQSSLPVSHPYYSAKPTVAAATAAATTLPRSIPGLQLWFDAADPLATGTPPANGANIATWYDKSGNQYNTKGGTTNATYSAAGLVFGGNSQYSLPDGCLPFNDTSYSYFFVLKVGGTGTNPFFSGGDGNGTRTCASFMCYSDGKIQTVWHNEGNYSTTAGYPANQTFMTCSLYSSGNEQIVGVNGTINSRTAGVKRVQVPTTNWIGYGVDISSYFGGTLCEILCYNTCLSTSQRQQVEGYLAWKWGIQSSLPETHPYVYFAPGASPQPYAPTGVQLWFDASDPLANGSWVSGGTSITTWYDKSGNGYNTTGLTGTVPYNSPAGALTFNGSSYFNLPDTVFPFNNTSFSIYIVLSYVNNGNQSAIGAGSGSGTTYVRVTGSLSMYIQAGTTGNATGTVTSNVPLMFSGIYTSGNNLVALVNGQNTNSVGISGARNTQNTPNYIGFVDGGVAMFGSISEILVFPVSHDATTRQSTEGYLAWKYGLQSSLPTNHPYYKVPAYPFISPVIPSLAGSQLWLDASDPYARGSRVSNGTSITTWFDKSGNRYNATATGGTLTYNSAKGVLFTGTPYYTLPDGAFPIIDLSYSIYMVLSLDDNNNRTVLSAGSGSNMVKIRGHGSQGIHIDSGPTSNSSSNGTAPNGTLVIYDAIYTSGTNLVTLVNGQNTLTVGSAGARNTQNTPNYIGFSPGNNTMFGSIAEILVFPTNHGTTTRQFAEGYLAWKWGLQTSLPTNHPYYSSVPAVTAASPPYTPRAFAGVPGIQLWFDASDPLATGTGVSNGKYVTNWNDKSGYDFNATVKGTVPYDSTTGGLTFDGTSFYTLPTNAYPNGNSAFSVYVMARTNGSYTILNWGNFSGNSAYVRVLTDDPNKKLYLDAYISTTATYTNNQTFLFDGFFDSVTGNEYVNLNGGTLTGPVSAGTRNIPTGPNFIACDLNTNSKFNGTIYEIQVYNIYHTTIQRQKVEGYLAWKWGVQAFLPVGHPYKSVAPATQLRDFPESMPGLMLWLSASDPLATGTGVSTGTNITTWYDKSRYGFNTTATGNIPYNSTTGGLTFNGSSYFTLATGSYPTGNSSFSIYMIANNAGGSATLLNYGAFAASSAYVRVMTEDTAKKLYLDAYINTTDTYTTGQPFLFTGSFDSTTGNEYVNLNGGTVVGPVSVGTRSVQSQPSYIGADLNTNSKFTGTIYEILIYKSYHTTSKRQQVEGYLAWKWNQQAYLPANHPYKKVAP